MDKTVVFKVLKNDFNSINSKDQSQYYMYSWKSKPKLTLVSNLNKNNNLKNKSLLIEKLITEFKNEIPDYLNSEINNVKNINNNFSDKSTPKLSYPTKIYRSNLAYFIKFSDNNMQVIFYDYTKLLIGSVDFPYLVYWDRKETPHIYCIHQINKSKNKNMLKRYEHYKKVFYEKIEQYVSNKVAAEEQNKSKNADAANSNQEENLELEMLSSSQNNEQELNKTL
jgi:hypothetical protein